MQGPIFPILQGWLLALVEMPGNCERLWKTLRANPEEAVVSRLLTGFPNPMLNTFFPNTKVLGCLNCGHDCRGDHTGIEHYFMAAILSHLRQYEQPRYILWPTPKSLASVRIHF